MPANITLKALGLNTSPNQLEVPPGSLIEAKNVVIRDNDIVSQRRGFRIYGNSFGTSSDTASQLFSYQNRILRYFAESIQFDTGTIDTSGVEIFKTFDGSFSPAQAKLRIKSIESNGNLYFTTANGIEKLSAATAADFTTNSISGAPSDAGIITKAGGVKAVDVQATVVYDFGNQTGFLPVDSTVAYRVLWLYNDANKNLIEGTPSQRAVVVNSLLTTTLQDFNFVLGALDNINQSGSLIDDGDYVSELRLPINASSIDVYNALLLLVSKLDTNILYADQVSVAPLQISMGSIVNGELVINFTSGDPSLYFIAGNRIDLNGFTITNPAGTVNGTLTNGINGGQTVASTFPTFSTTGNITQGSQQISHIITVADVSGNLGGTFFDINSANDAKQYYVWYNVSGSGNDPSIAGRTGIRVNITTNDTANTVALNTTNAINAQASSDFTAVNTGGPSAVIDVTNTIDGASTGADSGTSGFAVTTTTPGTAGNIITSVVDTSGIVNGSHITSPSPGIPTNTYVVSTTFNTITLSNNVTATTSSITLNFDAGLLINTTLAGTITTANATINDFTFESITAPTAPNNPATDAQLAALQTYLSNIIIALQNMPNAVIPTSLSTQFIQTLDVTNSVNVELQITIPANVTAYDFFQIYRSDIATAIGTTVLSDLSPNDELKLVYEAFPTTAQLSARSISVEDITPDVFRGADLYTNEASGVGLAQANDLPPFALDINRYKNVTFYANTKTLQRRLINLIGVINMVRDYGNGLNSQTFTSGGVNTSTDTITIISHGFTDTQSVEFHNTTPSNLPGGLVGSQTYYILNSTINTFQVSTVKSGTPVDLTSGGTGTHTVYNQLPKIVISDGTTTNVYNFIVGLNESTQFTTVAGSSLASSGTASYFFLNTTNDVAKYYVWYQIGTATDPLINGRIGIPVVALTGDTPTQIATKTANTLSTFIANFTVQNSTNTFTVTNTTSGATTDATPQTSGFTVNVLVQGSGENSSTNTVLLANLTSVGQSVDQTAQSLVRIINQNNNEIVNAFYLSTAGGVPGQIFLEARDLSNQAFYIMANNQDTGQSFSPDISPEDFIIANTATSPTVIQSSSPHGMINGDQVVIINSNSTPSIDGLHNITFVDSTHFSIPIVVTVAGNQGSFEVAKDALFSDNEKKPNRIYFSVFQQPDAVPLVNFLDVGSGDKAIIRIMPLRDSLFVFKEDGLWRISGEVAPFTVALFDSSCIVVAPDSVAVSNNMIFAWTARGIVVVTEGGLNNISNNTINDIVKPLSSATFPGFSTATWGIGYESDNSYTVFTVVNPEDTTPQIGYRYDQITNTWTTIDKDYTCGVIHEFDDRMYAGAGDLNVIEQERKGFTRLDFSDRELGIDLTPGQYFGTMMKFLVDVSDITDGDVLVQNQLLTLYQFNQTLKKLNIDPGTKFKDYYNNFAGDLTVPQVNLGAAENFAVLSNSAINSINGTIVNGDLGINPGTTVTGFPPGTVSGTQHIADVQASNAQVDLNLCYNDLATRLGGLNISGIDLGTLTLTPGIYKFTSTAQLTGTLTLDAQNLTDPLWIFQIGDTLTTAASASIVFINGGSPGDIFWQVGNDVVIGNNTTMLGNILAQVDITMGTGATLDGRALTSTGLITLDTNIITEVAVAPGGGLNAIGGDNLRTKLIDLTQKLDADPNVSDKDYFFKIDTKSGFIQNIKISNPTVITTTSPHGLQNGRIVTISGSNSNPLINDTYPVTVLSASAFTIQVNVDQTAGTTGSFTTIDEDFRDIQACYNFMINKLNLDTNIIFSNYQPSVGTTIQESIITDVNNAKKQLTMNLVLPYVEGPLIVFKAIPTSITYSPITFGDPLSLKHIRECTLMFQNKAFTTADLNFSSDLLPQLKPVPVPGDGNGIFGYSGNNQGFGSGFFGGASHGAPFRTYVPAEKQMCVYLNIQFQHGIAREIFRLYGITLTGETGISSRAYR